MRRLHGQSGHKSEGHTQSVVHCVGGWKTWPIDMCSNKDAGRSERETRTPCVKQAANRSKDMDKDRTTHYNKCITDRTRHDTTGQDTSLEHFSAKKVSLAIEALISRAALRSISFQMKTLLPLVSDHVFPFPCRSRHKRLGEVEGCGQRRRLSPLLCWTNLVRMVRFV